jgi:hypothetical protein
MTEGSYHALIVILLLPSLVAAVETWPMPQWPRATPAEVGLDDTLLQRAGWPIMRDMEENP